ncbi:MAG: ATP-grasp domain-containing protein [Candidatus Micrarchaeota archaeon]|nr:ATP-grasp domain-containing protein [Candidatus Micrarchaeota archaeon]
MKVMVTGAGGPASVCIIKDLKDVKDSDGGKKYELVSTDIDPLSPGLYMVSEKNRHIVPRVNDNGFINKMFRLARREKVNVVLPTVQEELIHFARKTEMFEDAGIKVAVSKPESLLVSNNKLRTYAFFKGASYCPELYNDSTVRFPAVIKPKDSRGSRGFYIAENEDELRVFLAKNERVFGKDNSIVMEFLNGSEYSTYGISDFKGKPLVAVPIKRILAGGTSVRAEVADNPKVKEIATDIASKLNLYGPWNVQLMESNDGVKLVEVNPRFAGTSVLAAAAGVNMPELTIRLLMGEKVEGKDLEYKTGVTMTRYSEEIFIEKDTGKVLRKE